MRLTDRTDYAFRVLMYLAANGERLATVGGIAARYGISHSHLTRVVWALGRAGFVETVRGRGGGLRLARPAEAIAACFPGGAGGCRIEDCCALKGVLAEAEAALFAVLDRYTVEDLVRGNPKLRTFLLDGRPDMRPSEAGLQGSVTVPRPSTSGRGARTRRDRRASPDSRSARGR